MSDQSNPPEGEQQQPKLIIDSDWKAQAQAEKAKFAEQEKTSPEKQSDGAGQEGEEGLPPANFRGLLGSLVTQALLYMGGIPDPQTGQPIVSLEYAKHYIDLLEVLQEKTKGNLEDDEKQELEGVLAELRSRFVQIVQAVEQHMSEQGQQGGPTGPGGMAGLGDAGAGPKSPFTG